MADLDEQLVMQAEEEERRRLELEELNQQDRLEMMQEDDEVGEETGPKPQQRDRAGELRERTKEKAEHAAKEAAEKALKKTGEKAAQEAVASTVTATSAVWGPVLLAILGIFLIVVIFLYIVAGMAAMCNDSGWKGTVARAGSKVSWFLGLSEDYCKQFTFDNFDNESLYTGGRSGGGGAGSTWGKLTDAQAREYLAQAGISVNARQPTTSLEGINAETINELISFKQGCDAWAAANGRGACNVVVTGGTEGGHSAGACSHTNGYKFDLRLDPVVGDYIRANFYDTQANRSDGAHMWQNTTSIYALEGDHWDVVTSCAASPQP